MAQPEAQPAVARVPEVAVERERERYEPGHVLLDGGMHRTGGGMEPATFWENECVGCSDGEV